MAAAMQVFMASGYHGARMRVIAQKANTNLALLNYYFRSKENLFKTVCSKFIDKMYSRLSKSFTTQTTLAESIASLVCTYIDALLETEELPLFMVNILAQHPELFLQTFQKKNFIPNLFQNFFEQVESEVAQGRIQNIQPSELLLNCISLCVFPFIAAPKLKCAFGLQAADFRELMLRRKTQIVPFILNAIYIPNPLPSPPVSFSSDTASEKP
ncbi:MAG: TetR/AcrR family transcriptional regulator [Cystobacterineae bacterium]|nr:TetR/AcrR family transcriptional regulator [Cystobacterineae bacterium]